MNFAKIVPFSGTEGVRITIGLQQFFEGWDRNFGFFQGVNSHHTGDMRKSGGLRLKLSTQKTVPEYATLLKLQSGLV